MAKKKVSVSPRDVPIYLHIVPTGKLSANVEQSSADSMERQRSVNAIGLGVLVGFCSWAAPKKWLQIIFPASRLPPRRGHRARADCCQATRLLPFDDIPPPRQTI